MSELIELQNGSCKRVDVDHVIAFLEGYGLFRPRNSYELQQGRELAVQMIGSDLADLDVFKRVEERCGTGMLLYHENEKITGMAGMLMLSQRGREALLLNKFDGRNPKDEYVARIGEPVYATYVWAGAGTTHEARTSIVLVGGGLRKSIFGGVPAFGRAVTPEGIAACELYLKMRPVGKHAPGLYWNAGAYAYEEAA